jgi:protein ImuA
MPISLVERAELSCLRRHIARIEGRLVEAEPWIHSAKALAGANENVLKARKGDEGRLALGIPALDSVLGGGLPLATLHEIRAAESREGAAAAGFALALVARLVETGNASSLLWIGEADARRESGELYAPGLVALGLDPAAIVAVAANTDKEALWAFEAGLACNGLSVAICELKQTSLDLTATRRCLLRARGAGVTGLLLRLGGEAEPSAAEMRFRLSAAPAPTIGNFARGVGRMAWRVTLEKNRNGRTGAFTVEWNAHERCFAERGESRDALPQHIPAAPFHRQADPLAPDRAALRRAS